MGAGQIGGISSLLDIDFNNAAGFLGVIPEKTEAPYVVYFMSQTLLFCVGSLIEAHVVLTTASCIYGERFRFEVFGGAHSFIENAGSPRFVAHIAIHKGYNHTSRFESSCTSDNLGLLLLSQQYSLNHREKDTEFTVGRIRYAILNKHVPKAYSDCRFYGWGSRRNGYLVPLLLFLRRVDVQIMPKENCQQMWNYGDKFLCLSQKPCVDDVGTALECGGFLRGIMTSRIIDRPCGVGFLDLSKYLKFLTCAVDDARDIFLHDDIQEFEFEQTTTTLATPKIKTVTEPWHDTSPDEMIDLPPKADPPKDSGDLVYDIAEATGTQKTTALPPLPEQQHTLEVFHQSTPPAADNDQTF